MTDGRLDARRAGQSTKKGRPFGSRDRFPRGTKDADRAKLLQAEVANLQRRLADFEAAAALNIWRGNVADMLLAAARGEYLPSTQQLYAARIVYLEAIEQTRREQEQHQAELEQERRTYHDGSVTLDRMIEQGRSLTADRNADIDALVSSGDMTPYAAKIMRSWCVPDAFDPPPLALPAPAVPSAPDARDGNGATSIPPDASSAPMPLPARPAAKFAAIPGLAPVDPADIVRVIWSDKPFQNFQTVSGRRFESNSACEVELTDADADDVRDLLRAGCRERK